MAYIGSTPGITILSVNDLLDINTDSPNDRDLLIFDSSTGKYIGQQLTTNDVGEGSNLYYTRVRFDSDLADLATIAAVRSYFSAGGDLIYDSNTGVFSFDVEQVYTQTNFDSDFNTSLDAAALGGVGLTYDSATNTLSISNTGVVAGTYGSASSIPVLTINAQGQIDSAGTVSVAGVSGVEYDSATGSFTVTTSAGTSFSDSITLNPFTTSDLSEGTNLYYTDDRVQTKLSSVSGDILPDSNEAYDIGSSSQRFKDLYLSGTSINLGNAVITANVEGEVKLPVGSQVNGSTLLTDSNTTDDITEGSLNLYYTTNRADSDTLAFLTTNSYATQTYVTNSINSVLDGAPAALDTLNELAAAINDDSDFAGTITSQLSTKLNIANFDSTFDTRLSTKTTNDLTEGSNLYYTNSRVDSDIDYRVTKSFVDNLNVDASTLDNQNGTYYLDYANFTNTPNVLDSANIKNIFSVSGDLNYDSGTGQFSVTTYKSTDFDSDFTDKTTDDLTEGTNLYYTTSRADSDFDTRLATKSTTNLAEGSNLYYTKVRVDSDVAQGFVNRTTDDLEEGENLYYTAARADSDFDTRLATKSTTNLSEGDNLYYTKIRVDSDVAQGFADRTTTDLLEGDNLYYTVARVDSNISSYLNVNSYATETYVTNSINSVLDGAPAALDTLNELAAAINDDSDFAGTITSQLSTKLNISDFSSSFDNKFTASSTDSLSEGTTNLYFTDERVDDRVANLITGANGIAVEYNDENNLIQIRIDSSPDLGFNLSGNTTDDLDEGINNLYFTNARVSAFVDQVTSDSIDEGSTNLYYTTARSDSDFDTRLATKSTDNVSEGDNLYYTKSRVDSDINQGFADRTTANLDEGANLYYTRNRFDSALGDTASIDTIRGYFSAAGDLSYDSATGVFQFDVEQVYTKSNFDSDFNAALDSSALNGTGLSYNSTTNTLSITDTGVVSGTYGSTSEIPVRMLILQLIQRLVLLSMEPLLLLIH